MYKERKEHRQVFLSSNVRSTTSEAVIATVVYKITMGFVVSIIVTVGPSTYTMSEPALTEFVPLLSTTLS